MMPMVMTGVERDGMLSLKGIMFSKRRGAFRLVAAVVLGLLLVQYAAAEADPNQIYRESTNALYNLDFSIAQSGYETLTREYPDNPDYWNALASSIWLKMSLDQQVLKLDPTFDDARLTIGTYDYVVGVVPGFVRFVVGVFGVRGAGKEAGIQQLELAAAKGKSGSTDAKMVLLVVYNREKKYDDSLRLINELHAKYPRNFLFELAKASIYGKMKDWDNAIQVYEQILAKVQAKKDGYERLRIARAYYRLADSYIQREQFEKAVEEFSHVVASKDATPNEKANAYLWMGKIFDSKQERSKAVQQYNLVLGLDCDPDLKAEAEKYKRTPFIS